MMHWMQVQTTSLGTREALNIGLDCVAWNV